MLKRVRGRLTYANVMATLAMVVALGLGSAWAADKLARNSVGAPQIEKNGVKAPEIAKNAVRKAEVRKNAVGTGEVKNASLLEQDFAPGQLPAGPPGEPGEDATNLFAYIEEDGSGGDATIGYATGVTSVSEPAGTNGEYTVAFDRDLTNCVVHATAGTGDPRAAVITRNTSIPLVRIDDGNANELTVQFRRSDADADFGVQVDTSFLISSFC